jgi:beta-glucosidase
MPETIFHFPRGFLWGTATASHQVEGNNVNNNWWRWEQEGRVTNGDKSGLACDWWGGRWREDLDRAAESGQNSHRLSIEWSRVQPAPDRWDEGALDHYREIVRGLNERGLTPMITLHHFSDPIWLSERGGWENESVIDLFSAYVEKTVNALGEYSNIWVTINEPNVMVVYGYLFDFFPPGEGNLLTVFRVLENIVRAHSAAYTTIHNVQPNARVGIATNYRGAKPAHHWNPFDQLVTRLQTNFFNNAVPFAIRDGVLRLPGKRVRIPDARGTQDFLGLNYYTEESVAFSLLHPRTLFSRQFFKPGVEISEGGLLANEPGGIFEALKWGRQFKIPIIITENGIDDSGDQIRSKYIIQHLHQVWRGINFNWPVKGYFYWTLVDNFEWERGWSQRFGLWELNVETQTRRKRASADLYAEICSSNSLSSDMVAKYAPQIFELLFPGM